MIPLTDLLVVVGVSTACALAVVLLGAVGLRAGPLAQPDHLARAGGAGRHRRRRCRGDGCGGLGLAIAEGLVRAHCGSIAIANAGPGCRVVVTLPAARPPVQEESGPLHGQD